LKNFIEKNGILVNNKIINNPYFKLKVGDKINFNLNLYPFIKYHFLKNFSKYSKPLSHILISYSTLTFYYFKLPKLKELDFGFKFNPNLFRQLYKKNKYFNNLKLI
jgi:ribosomal protein S4